MALTVDPGPGQGTEVSVPKIKELNLSLNTIKIYISSFK